ncbi:beta-lactoglobulin-1/B-like [Tamandua tetradactyla]|uniref:beta-lactoglobulin-1/B-like n=1 Tax=Tamandua tetradactyla TaxID=48850 RepID=UPI004053AC24
MRSLLLILGAALACGLQAVNIPQPVVEVDLEKLAGTWHTAAMAANDPDLLEPKDAPLRVYIKEVRPMATGGLEITLNKEEDGECVEKKIQAEKTQNPAQFKIEALDGGLLFLLDTDYTDYLFLCMESIAAPGGKLACQALARTPQADPEVMEKFNLVVKTLPMRIFLDMTQGTGECDQAPRSPASRGRLETWMPEGGHPP